MQGSLPIPLIISYDDNEKKGIFNVFVFSTDSLSKFFHVAIIGKPGIPLSVEQKKLNPDLTYGDSIKGFEKKYIERNFLNYYVNRNISVLKYLRKMPFISKERLVVAGHSEGAAIALKIAYKYTSVTDLIYSGGSPLGRVMSVIEREREHEDSTSNNLQSEFSYWEKTVENLNNIISTGDTFKGYYQFSVPPPIDLLLKLKIPILVTYGSKDAGAVSQNDYLRVQTIRNGKTNFTFKSYYGVEHNFFPVNAKGEINYEIFNWNRLVIKDWIEWVRGNEK
ncbi:MAG: dienelactone hydrolase family protein [Chitinophagaceae bacterium]|nr:dienelactone hydrolase family protein [Chitinophagaceae bacterium]